MIPVHYGAFDMNDVFINLLINLHAISLLVIVALLIVYLWPISTEIQGYACLRVEVQYP